MKSFGSGLFSNKSKSLSLIAVILCLAFVILVISFKVTYMRVYVVGPSMEDTLYGAPGSNPNNIGGDFVYIFKAKPDRGDIVVINTNNKIIIKRVIALGGDRVAIVKGKVVLNGVELEEPYVSPDNNLILNNSPEIVVKQGYVFFLGDNRDNSNDSRSYGCLPEKSVLGVVADWSLTFKKSVTAINTFFEFTLPSWFCIK